MNWRAASPTGNRGKQRPDYLPPAATLDSPGLRDGIAAKALVPSQRDGRRGLSPALTKSSCPLLHLHLDLMARHDKVWPRRRHDIPFAINSLLAKRLIEFVHAPSVIVVRVPVSPVGVIPSAIVGIPVIPIAVGLSPSRVHIHCHLSRSCLRDHFLTGEHAKAQRKTNENRERLLSHDLYLLAKCLCLPGGCFSTLHLPLPEG